MIGKRAAKKARGIFIAIDGTDGSGKAAQTGLLKDRLETEGYEVVSFHFPQIDQPSGYFAKRYTNGDYGDAQKIGPYTSSLFYALDRYEAAQSIRTALSQGKVVIANCYTGSTMAQQGTKFSHTAERRGFFIWLDNLEFTLLDMPRPDMNFVLRVPPELALESISEAHDIELCDLKKSAEVYEDLCRLFPKDFKQIDCVRSNKLIAEENIHTLLLEKIRPLLPQPSANKSLALKPTNPYITKGEDGIAFTKAGEDFLRKAVTSSSGNVYAFTNTLSPSTIAAAMARLSRRGDDMRITILDEFASATDKDEQLLQRVITAYGDDSVQQLVGQHLVVENASNLLTKKLEWGRLASYLEQSTRYIYFDQKNKDSKYKYFTPTNLDANTKEKYEQAMDSIFELYSEMVHRITDYVQKQSATPKDEQDAAWKSATRAQACDAIRPVLPVATQSTVGIFASGQALESLIMHLLGDELTEARETGQKILMEARKTIPTFLERADKPERGGATIAYRANTNAAMRALAKGHLPVNHADTSEPVTLTDVWPRNELDVVADMLYEHSSLPLEQIREEVSKWPYDKKVDTLKTYMGERLNRRHRPGRALEKAHYSFDLMCDYGIFRDLQRHRMVDDLEWQVLTPRYGYEIPQLVEDAGLSDLFEQCFEISLKLYSVLQKAGYTMEAQYATLLGHKMRWKVTINAREAFHFCELRTSPQGHPGYRKLAQQMHDAIANVHPLIAESMKFVNQGEDEELTRLAAERYTQFKLAQFSK